MSEWNTPTLASWVARAGLAPDFRVGPWSLRQVERTTRPGDAGAILVFGSDDAPGTALRVHVLVPDPSRRVFLRTPSLDLLYEPVADALRPTAATVVQGIGAALTAHDTGGLPPPPELPAPAPTARPAEAPRGAYAQASAVEPPDHPSRRVGEGPHFLDWRFLDVAELDRLPDAIRDMVDGRLGGLIVRRAFDPAAMARVVERIEQSEPAFSVTPFPERFRSRFLGRALDGSDPELTEYLPIAERFRVAARDAFAGAEDYQSRLEALLGRLSGGRRVAVPTFTDGRPYAASTVRVLPPGGQIGSHCGNEANTRPAYTHLNTLVDLTDQISFFLTLQAPEAGGELVVYSLQWKDVERSGFDHGHSQVDPLLADARWEAYRPEAGDLLIFDGGRYFHRVSVVRGARTRWTIGGFMMFSRDGQTLYYWS